MGDSSQVGPDNVVAFVDASGQNAAEMNARDSVIDLLEPHRVLLQRIGDKEQPLVEPDGPRVRDALDEKMAGILDRRQGARCTAARMDGTAAGLGVRQCSCCSTCTNWPTILRTLSSSALSDQQRPLDRGLCHHGLTAA
jgi:hypothetical protein